MPDPAQPDPPWRLSEAEARSPWTRLASAVSFIAQPAIVAVGVAAYLIFRTDAPSATQMRAMAIVAGLIVMTLLFSAFQVWRGAWKDMDASDVRERRTLNLFAAILLFSAAAASFFSAQPIGLSIGLAISGTLVLAAFLLRVWLKTSLHAAVIAFAAVLVWPHATLAGALCLAALVVAWSRLRLRRHTRAEVAMGLAIGVAAGFGYHGLIAAMGGPA
jgi:hypothetical protein